MKNYVSVNTPSQKREHAIKRNFSGILIKNAERPSSPVGLEAPPTTFCHFSSIFDKQREV